MKMRMPWVVTAALLLGMTAAKAWAVTGTKDGTITVTPLVTVTLQLSPTTYAFGSLAVNTSSVSATALRLSNIGDVDVSMQKSIPSNPANWIADTSTTTPNHFELYVATSVARPAIADFSVSDHQFGVVTTLSGLKGLGGSSPTISTVGGTTPFADLWFRLDMPVTVTSAASQTILVRFTGTGL